MAIVTLITDSGDSDHYVAAIKARMLSLDPDVRIVDISHKIPPCDIAHAAFVLRSVFRDFPEKTVHVAGIHATGNKGDVPIALQLENHFFLCIDNGLAGLLSDQPHQDLVALHTEAESTFPERDIFAPAAVKITRGVPLSQIGQPMSSFKRMIDRQVKATKKQIAGNVIHVDNFGNLITNIPREAFEILSRGKAYTIQVGGEKFRRIHTQYHQADEGECFLLFNSLGLLEIGICKGNASELLGLSYGSMVNVFFEE